jgi:hypothetical protein
LLGTDTTNAVRQTNIAPAPIAASTACSVSVYMRSSATPTNGYIQVNSDATGAAVAYFDLTAGTAVVGADLVAGMTAKSATITRAGAFWRCVFTLTTPAGSTNVNVFYGPCLTVSASGDNRSYVGTVGQGIYMWGGQCEAGAFPTSYIPTTGAPVTRAAEQATMPIAAWFNLPAGSLVGEANIPQACPNGTLQTIAHFDDGSVSNRIRIWNQSNSTAYFGGVTVGGAAEVGVSSGNVTPGTSARIGLTYGTGNVVMSRNGSVPVVSAAVGVPVAITSLRIGGTNGPPYWWVNGYIRRVRYWPRALSNTELQQVTT